MYYFRRNKDELRRMQDIRSQRLKMLQQHDQEALAWLEKNQHIFKKPILEPIVVSVNVIDPRYSVCRY